jgi:hypothetical protein
VLQRPSEIVEAQRKRHGTLTGCCRFQAASRGTRRLDDLVLGGDPFVSALAARGMSLTFSVLINYNSPNAPRLAVLAVLCCSLNLAPLQTSDGLQLLQRTAASAGLR